MKRITLAIALLAIAGAQAEDHDHKPWETVEQRPYQLQVVIPFDMSPFKPQDTIPEQCKDPIVEQYIADWEAGKVNFDTIAPNDSIPADKHGCWSMDNAGNYLKMPSCDLKHAPAGYMWKELADAPVTIGITNGGKSDHAPHFHAQPECYYAVSGRAPTLSDGGYNYMETGQYFYIPGNAIHNTPILDDVGFGVLYWYPKNQHFDGFQYKWRADVKYLRPAEEAFDRVDRLRKAALNLEPFGQNEARFQ